MIVITNTKTGESYYSDNKSLVADEVGVSERTIRRWEKARKFELYNDWIIGFNARPIKVQYANYDLNKYELSVT